MMGQVLVALGLIAAGACAQYWSTARRNARTEKVDLPRWGDDGGTPAPPAAGAPAAGIKANGER